MTPSRSPFLSVAFVVAVLVQLLAVSRVAVCWRPYPDLLRPIKFHVSDAYGYAAFMEDFHFLVTSTTRRFIELSPVHGEQFLKSEPATWLKVNLSGEGDNHAVLFIRSDNLSVRGFSNKAGRFFAFKDEENKIGDTIDEENKIALNFAGNYRDLFPDVGHAGLSNLPISRHEAARHLEILANFGVGADDDDDENLKRPLAFFILLISEAERFVDIRNAVFERWAWNDNLQTIFILGRYFTCIRQRIEYNVIRQVVHWSDISCALLTWAEHGGTLEAWWRNEKARQIDSKLGIKSPRDALSRINLILNVSLRKRSRRLVSECMNGLWGVTLV